jgi:hypothetical protein
MKNAFTRYSAVLPLVAIAGVAALLTIGPRLLAQASRPAAAAAAAPSVTVYKSATCGCCSKWVEHMKTNGFNVTALDVEDIEVPMKTYGVPTSLASCHTAVVGGYVVEGHVPADLVHKMLKEKPAIAGIAAPGMPVGSPGMEVPGTKAAAYDVMSFTKDGKTAVYAKR